MANSIPMELSRLLDAPGEDAREAAWSALIAQNSRLLLHVAREMGGGYDAALDRYAHVLEKLREDDFRRLRAYVPDDRSRFTTWLVVVARRLCVDFDRQRYGRVRNGDAAPDGESSRRFRRRLADLLGENVELRDLPDGMADPASDAASADVRDRLDAALRMLPPSARVLLKLRYEDDLSAREAASIMGLPTLFHVYRHERAALATLRAQLQRVGIDRAEA